MRLLLWHFRAGLIKIRTSIKPGNLSFCKDQLSDQIETNTLQAYLAGHSKLKYGFHNVTGKNGEKESLAIDLLDDDFPTNIGTSYILQLTAVAEKHGLTTGARWGLTVKLAAAVDNAISAEDWNAKVKVGWDPVHLEPANFTVAEAKADKRPKFS